MCTGCAYMIVNALTEGTELTPHLGPRGTITGRPTVSSWERQ